MAVLQELSFLSDQPSGTCVAPVPPFAEHTLNFLTTRLFYLFYLFYLTSRENYMDNAVNRLAKQGQSVADNAADKVQAGLRDAGGKVEDIRSEVTPGIRNAASQAQTMAKQGLDAVSEAAGRARDMASSTSQSIVNYTKENPVKALMIAAASGALLLTLSKVIKASRN